MSESGDDGRWQTDSGWQRDVEWELDSTSRAPRSGANKRRPYGAFALVAIGGIATVAIIVGLLATSPNETAETTVADIEPTPAPTPVPSPTPQPEDPAPPTGLDIDEAVAAVEERAAQEFRRQLTRMAVSMGIVYKTGDELTLIDFESGEANPLTPGLNVPLLADIEFFRTADGITYAIDPETRQATIAATEGFVVKTMFDDFINRTDKSRPVTGLNEVVVVEPLAGGEPSFDIMVPPGAERVLMKGVGMVFVDGTGSSLVGPGGLIHLSDGFIVAGNERVWLEKVCNSLRCELRLVSFDTHEMIAELPSGFSQPGDTYVVSPTGEHVLRVSSEGGGELYTVADGGVSWLIGAGMEHPTFAPDNSFIAWLDTSDPTRAFLKVVLLDPRQWLIIDLSSIGAGAPDGTEFLVYDG